MRKLKVGIIIPLRAPESTSNWPVVAENCKRTLHSIFQSTSSNYQVALACHQPPNGLKNDEHLRIVELSLPIPSDLAGYRSDMAEKFLQAAKVVRQQKVDYIMKLDADDLIHRELIGWVVNRPLCHGFRVHKGWAYRGGIFARRVNNFDRSCGSSIISADVPHKSGVDPIRIGHYCAKGYYETIGKPLTDVPFRAVCRLVGYGGSLTEYKRRNSSLNITRLIKHALYLRPVREKFLKDFGIESRWINPPWK